MKSIVQPKRDFKKVILSHDLFILFLHGTKCSDSYAESREGGLKKKTKEKEKEKKEAKPKGHDSGALQRSRKWIDCNLKVF